jgi:hypothetical protein
MLSVSRHRRLAGALGAMLLGSGCATAPVPPTGGAQFTESSRESECEQSARTASTTTGTWADVAGSGMLAALLGALEGATSSTWRGTRAGRDSWIGAAAGAGAGMVAGIRRVREAQAVYVVAYQSCMVEAPAPIDPTLLSDGSVSDDEAPRPAYMGPPLQP